MGYFREGEIFIYIDNTKTISETATTLVHEATHAKINKPNTKNQELECFMNEKRHKGIQLTASVKEDIIKYINEKYAYLYWE